ncbi:hypothetical protein [Flammeovirga sp. OC4]|uniref:hypothetical protein n=1 Tax=Flammeovirga sp. OC4 TaxID=1382345 RepID=UPI0012E09D31|nr:hypothetical protein [Flammeovirga sp. OC4]
MNYQLQFQRIFILNLIIMTFSCTRSDQIANSKPEIVEGFIQLETKGVLESASFFNKQREVFLSVEQHQDSKIFRYQWHPQGFSEYNFNQTSNQLSSTFFINDTICNIVDYVFDSEMQLKVEGEEFELKKYYSFREKKIDCIEREQLDTLTTLYFSPKMGIFQEFSCRHSLYDLLNDSYLVDKTKLPLILNEMKKDKRFYPNEKEVALRRALKGPVVIDIEEEEEDIEIEIEIPDSY